MYQSFLTPVLENNMTVSYLKHTGQCFWPQIFRERQYMYSKGEDNTCAVI